MLTNSPPTESESGSGSEPELAPLVPKQDTPVRIEWCSNADLFSSIPAAFRVSFEDHASVSRITFHFRGVPGLPKWLIDALIGIDKGSCPSELAPLYRRHWYRLRNHHWVEDSEMLPNPFHLEKKVKVFQPYSIKAEAEVNRKIITPRTTEEERNSGRLDAQHVLEEWRKSQSHPTVCRLCEKKWGAEDLPQIYLYPCVHRICLIHVELGCSHPVRCRCGSISWEAWSPTLGWLELSNVWHHNLLEQNAPEDLAKLGKFLLSDNPEVTRAPAIYPAGFHDKSCDDDEEGETEEENIENLVDTVELDDASRPKLRSLLRSTKKKKNGNSFLKLLSSPFFVKLVGGEDPKISNEMLRCSLICLGFVKLRLRKIFRGNRSKGFALIQCVSLEQMIEVILALDGYFDSELGLKFRASAATADEILTWEGSLGKIQPAQSNWFRELLEAVKSKWQLDLCAERLKLFGILQDQDLKVLLKINK